MIDEKLVLLKEETASELKRIDVDSYKLDKTDARLTIYIKECISNPAGHNLYELLAIKRFFLFLGRYDFRPREVKRFIVLYERLKFSGTRGRTRYKLTPIQVFQFTNIMGFYRKDKINRRVIREVLLFVPRKFSKTTSVSALAIDDMLLGDANAQSYVAANSYNQAQICFGEISAVLKSLDPKLRHFKINREVAYNKRRGKSSFCRCLASKADTLDGLNASVVIVDEYAQADSAALKNVLTSSMGARRNPLTVVITTASDKFETPFTELLKTYQAILREEIENDSIFAHIFQPDEGDEEGDPATWHKVHPHLNIIVSEDFYREEYKKALTSAPDMLDFRTKMLNIFSVDSSKKWIEPAQIEKLFKKVNPDEATAKLPTMVAVDLSVCDDFSSVTYNSYSITSKSFHSVTDYYFPEGALPGHPNEELYRKWAADGYLKLCKGSVIDYQQIVNDILARSRHLNIINIGYDPYRSIEFVNLLAASAGGNTDFIIGIKQTYGTFTSPVESFELAVNRGLITFDPNPITPYCFGNALIDEDRLCNRKPIKKTRNAKIDSTITNLMTFYLFNNFKS